MEPAEIYGQPYRGETAHQDRIHALIVDVRRAMACVDIPPDLDTAPRSLNALATEVTALQRMLQRAQHIRLGTHLPAALTELSAHAHEAGSPRTWRLLNQAVGIGVGLARRLGYGDPAGLGVEHAVRTAELSDDANLPQVAQLARSQLLIDMGAWAPDLRLVRQAAQQTDRSARNSQTIYGALHLRTSILAARAGDRSSAWDHHAEAAETAEQLPARAADPYGFCSPGGMWPFTGRPSPLS